MDFIFPFPLIATFLFFVCLYINIWKKKSTNKTPPGPWKLPFFGNIHQLATSQPHRRLAELAKIHGPIMQIQIGQIPAVIISSAELAKQNLKTEEHNFLGRPSLLAVEILMYNRSGITFLPYGDYWRQMKKIAILEVLTAKRVKSFRLIRQNTVSKFLQHRRSKSGSPVNLTSNLPSVLNSIIAISTTGKKCKKEDELLENIPAAMEAAGGFFVAEAFPSLLGLPPVISGMKYWLNRIHQQADRIVEEIVNEHKAERATDTSWVTIQWAMSELMNFPEAMKKAQEEVRQVCRGKETVNEEDFFFL